MLTIQKNSEGWLFKINKNSFKFESLYLGFDWYLSKLKNVFEVKERIQIKFGHESGNVYCEFFLTYAISDIILFFISKLNKDDQLLKICDINKENINDYENKNTLFISQDLEKQTYKVSLDSKEETSNVTLKGLFNFFGETKILGKTDKVMFTLESHLLKNENKSSIFIISTFDRNINKNMKDTLKDQLVYFNDLVYDSIKE